jgi:hypothetical protein
MLLVLVQIKYGTGGIGWQMEMNNIRREINRYSLLLIAVLNNRGIIWCEYVDNPV